MDGTFYVLDSTTIELCLNIFKWAKFVKTKAAIKLHTVLDLKGNIPAFFCITNAKTHDVNFIDMIDIETGAYYIMDRGYLDFRRLFKIDQSGAFFATRAKKNLKIRAFWGYSSNAVKTQICIAICSYLVAAVIKKKLKIERNLYEILQILSVSPFDKIRLDKLISEAELQTFEEHPQKQASLWNY